MAAYIVVDTRITQPEVYKEYQTRAKPLLEKYGAEILAHGGKLSVKENMLWSPTRIVVMRFPSAEQAEAFYGCPEFQEVLAISKRSAERTLLIVDGV